MMKICLLFILICITQNDDDPCRRETDKNKCFSIKLETPGDQCCLSNENCFSISLIPFLLGSDIVYKSIQKEILKYNPYGEFTGECKSGKISLANKDMELTEAEQEIVKLNNYCLNYHENAKNGVSLVESKENCFNAKILDSSNQLGLECGFYDFIFISQYGEKTIKTCFLLNPSILSQSTIDDGTKLIMNHIAKDLFLNSNYTSFTSKIYSSKGISKIYDSTKETLEDIPNSSKILIYKYLFLLFLMLIL